MNTSEQKFIVNHLYSGINPTRRQRSIGYCYDATTRDFTPERRNRENIYTYRSNAMYTRHDDS